MTCDAERVHRDDRRSNAYEGETRVHALTRTHRFPRDGAMTTDDDVGRAPDRSLVVVLGSGDR